MKKAQITLLVIVVVAILLSIYLASLLKQENIDSKLNPFQVIDTPDLFPVSKYIDYCLEKSALPLVQKISLQGGSLDLDNKSKFIFMNQTFLILFSENNYLLTTSDIEKELEKSMLLELNNCFNFSLYEKEGYDVSFKDPNLNVSINKEDILFSLYLPITLRKNNEVITNDYFSFIFVTPFGNGLSVVNDIINKEVNDNYDLDFFRLRNSNFNIFKTNIYPYDVFILETKYPKTSSNHFKFMFAIKNLDISNLKYSAFNYASSNSNFENYFGSCKINDICYSKSIKESCLSKKGIYSHNSCVIENVNLDFDSLIELFNQKEFISKVDPKNLYDSSCFGWYDSYTGNYINGTKFNGESWCSYESGIGGKHYKLSCVNGNVIVEPCSDFSDEVCANDTYFIETDLFKGDFSTAVCRENRFLLCSNSKDKFSCETIDRDCYWNFEFGCIPALNPQNKFWEDEADNICLNTKDDGLSCYNNGCGEQTNFYGLTNVIYNKDKINILEQNKIKNLNLKKETLVSGNYLNLPSSYTDYEFIDLLNNKIKIIDYILLYDITDYLNPLINFDNNLKISSNCNAFSPAFDNCNLCSNTNFFNGSQSYSYCTELKCKSLGNCIYDLNNGFPSCNKISSNNNLLEIYALNSNYPFESDVLISDLIIETPINSNNNIKGIVLTEPVLTKSDFIINYETNFDSICKLSLSPFKKFDEISSSQIDPSYSKDHSIILNFNSEINILNDLKKYFNVNNNDELLQKIIDLKFKLDLLKKEFPNSENIETVYKLVYPFSEYYLDEEYSYIFKEILKGYDEGYFYLFLNCVDSSRNENIKSYVKFKVENSCYDVNVPKIIDVYPKNNSFLKKDFIIYLDELADCKYDYYDLSYSDMRFSFNCSKSKYDDIFCKDEFINEFEEEGVNLFIKCADHPEFDLKNKKLILNLSRQKFYDDAFNSNIKHLIYISNNSLFSKVDLRKSISNINKFFVNSSTLINETTSVIKIYVPFTNYTELYFGEEYSCFNSKCNSQSCILENFNGIVECEKVISCKEGLKNVMDESYKLRYNLKTSINLVNLTYNEGIYNLIYEQFTPSDLSCGIRINDNDGYYTMNKITGTEFIYSFKEEVTSKNVSILCIDSYGTEIYKNYLLQ